MMFSHAQCLIYTLFITRDDDYFVFFVCSIGRVWDCLLLLCNRRLFWLMSSCPRTGTIIPLMRSSLRCLVKARRTLWNWYWVVLVATMFYHVLFNSWPSFIFYVNPINIIWCGNYICFYLFVKQQMLNLSN